MLVIYYLLNSHKFIEMRSLAFNAQLTTQVLNQKIPVNKREYLMLTEFWAIL